MRSLLRGDRQGSLGVVLGLVAVICLAAYALAMALGWRNQFYELKHTIYQRCTQREAYDQASQAARAAQRDYYQRLVVNLHRHPSRQAERFNAALERSARQVVTSLQTALDNGAPTGCAQYR